MWRIERVRLVKQVKCVKYIVVQSKKTFVHSPPQVIPSTSSSLTACISNSVFGPMTDF